MYMLKYLIQFYVFCIGLLYYKTQINSSNLTKNTVCLCQWEFDLNTDKFGFSCFVSLCIIVNAVRGNK